MVLLICCLSVLFIYFLSALCFDAEKKEEMKGTHQTKVALLGSADWIFFSLILNVDLKIKFSQKKKKNYSLVMD